MIHNPPPASPAEPLTLVLFTSDCGHRYIGHLAGFFGCPVCGRADGDHHLTGMEELPVQLDDWNGGLCFREIGEASFAAQPQHHEELGRRTSLALCPPV